MPKSTDCLVKSGGNRMTVSDALSLGRQERRSLVCIECRRRVIPHSTTTDGTQAAHFEHRHRNSKCSRSDKRFR
jgi:hypothetical protein